MPLLGGMEVLEGAKEREEDMEAENQQEEEEEEEEEEKRTQQVRTQRGQRRERPMLQWLGECQSTCCVLAECALAGNAVT